MEAEAEAEAVEAAWKSTASASLLSNIFYMEPFPRLFTANFLGEEFFQPKILLLKKGIFARNTALLGTHMYAAGADILSEFLVGLWL